jgi:CRP-like cAMP-binding protein
MRRRRIGSRGPAQVRSPRLSLQGFPLDGFAPGTVIVAQGTRAPDVFVVGDGLVKLTHRRSDGRSTVVGLRARGSLLGVEPALAGRTHPLTATAVTPCRCHRIPSRRFEELLGSNSRLTARVRAAQFEELERNVDQLVGLARLSARERLETCLELMQGELGRESSRGEVELPLRDWELAQLLAVTPTYLSRLMRELEREGRLVRSGRRARVTVRADAGRRTA